MLINLLQQSMACNNTLLSSSTDVLFALGFNNGRILLNSFDTSNSVQPAGLVGKEFTPKVTRSCNTLDFNQVDNNFVSTLFLVIRFYLLLKSILACVRF